VLILTSPSYWVGVRAGDLRPGNVYALTPTGVMPSEWHWYIIDQINQVTGESVSRHQAPPLVEIVRRGEPRTHVLDAAAVVVKGARRGQRT
jgi:hypothetical protein